MSTCCDAGPDDPGVLRQPRSAIDERRGSGCIDGEAFAFVLDELPVGVILVDRAGEVVWANRCAQESLRGRGGLSLCDGRLVAATDREATALQRLIEAAVVDYGRQDRRAPATIAIPRSDALSLVVVIRPLPRSTRRGARSNARVVVFLSDPSHGLRTSRSRLQSIFGLTPAESALIELLAAGHSLQSAAQRLDISLESARTYSKRAFEKTGTRRQGELVRLALALTPAGADEA